MKDLMLLYHILPYHYHSIQPPYSLCSLNILHHIKKKVADMNLEGNWWEKAKTGEEENSSDETEEEEGEEQDGFGSEDD